jgi:hypothetical protein
MTLADLVARRKVLAEDTWQSMEHGAGTCDGNDPGRIDTALLQAQRDLIKALRASVQRECEEHAHCKPAQNSDEIIGFHRGLYWVLALLDRALDTEPQEIGR